MRRAKWVLLSTILVLSVGLGLAFRAYQIEERGVQNQAQNRVRQDERVNNYRVFVGASWVSVQKANTNFYEVVKTMARADNKMARRDRMKRIQTAAQDQRGRLSAILDQLDAQIPPTGYEAFHGHLRLAIKNTIAYYNTVINITGRPQDLSTVALTTASAGAKQQYDLCNADPLMSAVLKPEFDGNLFSEAADKLIALAKLSERPVATGQSTTVVVVQGGGGYNTVAGSPYVAQMRQLLNEYFASRDTMAQWAAAARVNSRVRWNDALLLQCLHTRQSILAQMQSLAPDPGYQDVHGLACRMLEAAVVGTNCAYQTNNPNDPTFQRASDAISSVQDTVASRYGL